jgi:soluble lytic murein transglycosylase
MKVLKFFFRLVILTFIFLNSQTLAVEGRSIVCLEALKLAGKDDFKKAKEKLKGGQCTLTADLVNWLYLKSDTVKAPFQEYVDFLNKNPGWPWEAVLKKRAELSIDETLSHSKVLAWFTVNPPRTLKGLLYYVEALGALGKNAEISDKVRTFLQDADLNKKEEKNLLEKMKKFLRAYDIKKYGAKLLEQGKFDRVEHLYPYLSPSDRTIFKARISLKKKEDDVLDFLRQKKLNPTSDVDFAKDYLTWLRKQKNEKAIDFFNKISSLTQKYPEKFWKERYILAHEALEAGKAQASYKLASQHGLKKGIDYVEGEWFCGWIALRFMDNPDKALHHFSKLELIVETPISRARIFYWLGRTFERMGRKNQARIYYQKASCYKTTFYGQQALQKLWLIKNFSLQPLKFTSVQKAKFEAQKSVKLIRLLAKAGLPEHILSFAYVFTKNSTSHREKKQILALVYELAPEYAVEIAYIIGQTQDAFYQEAYPCLKADYVKNMPINDIALTHAVIRKESKFNSKVISLAGAHGLMQLMPETAKLTADQFGIRFSKKQLLVDPFTNVKLGSLYLKEQLKKYDHSLPLTLASYNAGPGTLSRWLERFPDPRHKMIDVLDWIEILPYSETRNYIHRVLENYTIYKRTCSR